MIVTRIECELYSSNIYVLEDVQSDYCWLVDIGEKNLCIPGNKRVKGVFITHTHIDHIQGINDILEKFPECIIYVNKAGKEGLYNDKDNLTFYYEEPLCFKGGNVRTIKEGDKVQLFDFAVMEFVETPGHHPSCVCFKSDKYLFTGDSYIPGFPVITKLKGGNRIQAAESESRIKSLIDKQTVICPGHGEIVRVPLPTNREQYQKDNECRN